MWADLYKDLAETYPVWKKIDRSYERAYEKLRQAEENARGSFLLLLLIWAETLRRHARAAEKHGLPDKAKALWEEAGKHTH